MKKLMYVQFQPGNDFLNGDFLMLTPQLRGIYLTVKMYLYANDGACQFNPEALAAITNCPDFAQHWQKVEHMFVIKNNTIKHKDVTTDLKRARKCIKDKRRAGLMSAKKRQQRCNTVMNPVGVAVATKKSKVNETESEKKRKLKPNSNSTSDFSRASFSIPLRSDFASDGQGPAAMHLKFYDLGCELLGPASQSDRTCIRLISDWLKYQYEKTGDRDIFNNAWRLAQEAKRNARKPMAMFISLVKTELGYRKPSKEITG